MSWPSRLPALPLLGALLCLAALGPSACTADPAREADRAYTAGLAHVESVTVEVDHGEAPAARALVRGTLPDPCTSIDQVSTRRLAGSIEVQLTTRRPFGAQCAQVVVPFEREVWLPIDHWASGLYLLDVNGVTESFRVRVNP